MSVKLEMFNFFVGFPNTIGVVDGCLIDIKKPSENANEYICRYQTPAKNIMVNLILKYSHCSQSYYFDKISVNFYDTLK